MGQEDFSHYCNPDLASILGETDLNFDVFTFYFCIFADPRFPDLRTPLAPTDELSEAQPDTSPNAPRNQIRCKEPVALAAIYR